MVLGLLDRLQIFSQLYLIELVGLLTGRTTKAVARDIFKAFDRVLHADLLHKLKSHGISSQIFDLISSFRSNRQQLQVVLDEKSAQEYLVNAVVPQGSILGPTLFLRYTNDLPDNAISDVAIYADDTTLYSKCDL